MWATIRKRLRLPRFSLRTLLVVVMLLGILLGYQTRRAHRQQRAVAAVEALGGIVWYDFHCDHNGHVSDPVCKPPVAARWLGRDMTSTVVNVSFAASVANDVDFVRFADLSGLKILDVANTDISDTGLLHLHNPQYLRGVDVNGTQVTDAGVASLRSASPLLRIHHNDEFGSHAMLIEDTRAMARQR